MLNLQQAIKLALTDSGYLCDPGLDIMVPFLSESTYKSILADIGSEPDEETYEGGTLEWGEEAILPLLKRDLVWGMDKAEEEKGLSCMAAFGRVLFYARVLDETFEYYEEDYHNYGMELFEEVQSRFNININE